MNPTGEQPAAAAAVGLQPPRSSFSSSCERHPEEKFSGFCPSCLFERLTTLDQSASAVASSSSRRNSTSSSNAATAIKALFRVPSDLPNKNNKTTTTRTSFFPELRRTKSFSASKNEGLAGVWEPQRKSCDVRGRNTLCSLFSIHDENKPTLGNNATLLETNKEDDEEIHNNDDDDDEEEIRVTEEIDVNGLPNIVAEEAEIEEQVDATVDDLKTMKDHIDLNSQPKKPSLSNLWSAASVLSKKWHKWRRKQKKSGVGSNGAVLSSTLPVEKQTSRETRSEIADYGFGRRSCDIDPRFSLDAGRISFDDPRYSFDEPRASWDGYLIGRTFPRLPPMVEDVPVVHVSRCDTQIPVEETSMAEDNIPGGSIQTREYYLDSSSKSRRKSLDRSNSIRRMAASVVTEMDETKVSNAKVSPATIDYNPVHGGSTEKEAPRISTSNSLRDDCSETFELGFRDNGTAIGAGKKDTKKPRRWRWKLWGFIQRRSGNKDDDEDRCSSVNGVGRSYSESWQDLRREGNNNRKVFRSNSSVSWRKSNENGNKIMRGGDEFFLERNRSARYSPNHVDNGLLRFYLAPLSASASAIRRGTRPTNNSRSMLGLY